MLDASASPVESDAPCETGAPHEHLGLGDGQIFGSFNTPPKAQPCLAPRFSQPLPGVLVERPLPLFAADVQSFAADVQSVAADV